MPPCRHTRCVEVWKGEELRLSNPKRFDRLVGDLTSQYPLVVHLVGSRTKEVVLEEAFDKSYSQCGLGDLYLYDEVASQRTPVLLMNSNPCAPLPSTTGRTCHPQLPRDVRWQSPADSNTFRIVLSRLLFPVSDIILLFADDFGGIEAACKYVESCVGTGIATSAPGIARPCLLVISRSNRSSPTGQIVRETFEHYRDRLAFSSQFSIAQLVYTSPHGPRALTVHLKSMLLQRYEIRREKGLLFAAHHLCWLFDKLVEHVAGTIVEPFDFVRVSRLPRQVPEYAAIAIGAFLRLTHDNAWTVGGQTAIIASALLLDGFPRGAHRFTTESVFETLYAGTVHDACQILMQDTAWNSGQCARYLVHMLEGIRVQMRLLMEKRERQGEPPLSLHNDALKPVASLVGHAHIGLKHCCLYCLLRCPEHVMKCGHALCDDCVILLGEQHAVQRHCFILRKCPVCALDAEPLMVALKPPTAGVRILCIDGGGVRGLIPLLYLQALDQYDGRSCGLPDFFDLAVGTSAGGIIVLGLYANKWKVPVALEEFIKSSKAAFTDMRSLSSRIRAYSNLVLRDGLYDGHVLDTLFSETYGYTRRLVSSPHDGVSSAKYAVTAVSADTGCGRLFTSYNCRKAPRAVGGDDVEQEPTIWQCARATSAAPGYFPVIAIGSSTWQDGAIQWPNPLRPALSEASRIWRSNDTRDLVLSIGTGWSPSSARASDVKSKWLHNHALLRLLRWRRKQDREFFSGEAAHADFSHDANIRQYHRLNLAFPAGVPRVDDVDSMASMESLFNAGHDRQEVAMVRMSLVASALYFELNRLPQHVPTGRYLCQGALRLRGTEENIRYCLQVLDRFGARIEIHEPERCVQLAVRAMARCDACGQLDRPLSFYVSQPGSEIDIRLRLKRGLHTESAHEDVRSIAGFPQSMESCGGFQGLDNPFMSQKSTAWCNVCDHDLLKRAANSPGATQGNRRVLKLRL